MRVSTSYRYEKIALLSQHSINRLLVKLHKIIDRQRLDLVAPRPEQHSTTVSMSASAMLSDFLESDAADSSNDNLLSKDWSGSELC